MTLPFIWAKLKILKGEWILDQNGFRNTQHANNHLNPPYTTENNRGPEKMVWNGDLWELLHVMK